jgi:hypothetical protein
MKVNRFQFLFLLIFIYSVQWLNAGANQKTNCNEKILDSLTFVTFFDTNSLNGSYFADCGENLPASSVMYFYFKPDHTFLIRAWVFDIAGVETQHQGFYLINKDTILLNFSGDKSIENHKMVRRNDSIYFIDYKYFRDNLGIPHYCVCNDPNKDPNIVYIESDEIFAVPPVLVTSNQGGRDTVIKRYENVHLRGKLRYGVSAYLVGARYKMQPEFGDVVLDFEKNVYNIDSCVGFQTWYNNLVLSDFNCLTIKKDIKEIDDSHIGKKVVWNSDDRFDIICDVDFGTIQGYNAGQGTLNNTDMPVCRNVSHIMLVVD